VNRKAGAGEVKRGRAGYFLLEAVAVLPRALIIACGVGLGIFPNVALSSAGAVLVGLGLLSGAVLFLAICRNRMIEAAFVFLAVMVMLFGFGAAVRRAQERKAKLSAPNATRQEGRRNPNERPERSRS
jgi:hypothetical protein